MADETDFGLPIVIDTAGMSHLAAGLRAVAPAAWKEYRKVAVAIGEKVKADAAQRASFSPRISQSGKVTVTAAGRISVQFGGGDAWYAVPIENRGRGFVEHPTFGHAPVTNKNSHPAFLHPAWAQNREWAVVEIQNGLTAAAQMAINASLEEA